MKNKKLKKIKKGPLSNSEKSDILNRISKQEDVSTIATQLNRSPDIIKRFVDENSVAKDKFTATTTDEADTEETPSRTRTSELFARNEKYGVTVMTAQASEAGDDSRKQRVKAASTHRYSDCTTTIRKAKND
jgi:IS30 family transposase